MKTPGSLRILLVTSFLLLTAAGYSMNVPKPMAIDIDDLGWKEGWDLHESGGPYRLGLPRGRMMTLEDYEVIVTIGKAAGVRIKSLFIMSEFDRSNICAQYPTTNEHGRDWDNSRLVNDNDFVIMNYVKENAAHIEFGLHGVRHEFWDAETRKPTRAEWADNQKKRPYKVLWGHLECFKKLIDQYGMDFPQSVRTAAANYYYNPDDPEDSGALMSAWGVKYATLPPKREYVTNHGLMVLMRSGGVAWDAVNSAPETYPETEFMTSHWTNFVDVDPADNHLAADKWITWFNKVKADPDRYTAKNTAQLHSQFLYNKYAQIAVNGNTVTIDNTNMPDWAYTLELLGNLLLKHKLNEGEHISSATLNEGNIACYYEERDYAHVMLPRLEKKRYSLSFTTGSSTMPAYVLNDGTYNVEDFQSHADNARIRLEMYGTQPVKAKLLFEPREVTSDNAELKIKQWRYEAPFIDMLVYGRNIQGQTGTIRITGESSAAIPAR
ncbi:MAG: hypothetical protein JSW66_16375 [Phycisphaerales bacterium]|nr:MAG: hypothetical protein JSW66_16375 [Phycisphaerales bacterium]